MAFKLLSSLFRCFTFFLLVIMLFNYHRVKRQLVVIWATSFPCVDLRNVVAKFLPRIEHRSTQDTRKIC